MTEANNSAPTPKDRRLLRIWCLSTFFPCVGIFLYLPASTQPSLESFSEEPHLFSAFLGFCLLVSTAMIVRAKTPAFSRTLRRKMQTGSATATLFFLAYSTYVYSFSALPPAPDAPSVGEIAPDFSVEAPEGRKWKLSEMKGDVLVFFYRGHW